MRSQHGIPFRDDGAKAVYREFEVTFFPRTERVNSIIVTDRDYLDPNGLRIGNGRADVADAGLPTRTRDAPDTVDDTRGILYWFDGDGRVERIALAAELLLPESSSNEWGRRAARGTLVRGRTAAPLGGRTARAGETWLSDPVRAAERRSARNRAVTIPP